MADPLSIATSILAFISTAEAVGKVLLKLKKLQTAPDEYLAYINEVSDLRNILSSIRDYMVRNTSSAPVSHTELSNLSALIERAKATIIEVDSLIQYRIVKAGSLKISRREWVRAKDTIEKFRQILRDIRLSIIAQMVVINS